MDKNEILEYVILFIEMHDIIWDDFSMIDEDENESKVVTVEIGDALKVLGELAVKAREERDG